MHLVPPPGRCCSGTEVGSPSPAPVCVPTGPSSKAVPAWAPLPRDPWGPAWRLLQHGLLMGSHPSFRASPCSSIGSSRGCRQLRHLEQLPPHLLHCPGCLQSCSFHMFPLLSAPDSICTRTFSFLNPLSLGCHCDLLWLGVGELWICPEAGAGFAGHGEIPGSFS